MAVLPLEYLSSARISNNDFTLNCVFRTKFRNTHYILNSCFLIWRTLFQSRDTSRTMLLYPTLDTQGTLSHPSRDRINWLLKGIEYPQHSSLRREKPNTKSNCLRKFVCHLSCETQLHKDHTILLARFTKRYQIYVQKYANTSELPQQMNNEQAVTLPGRMSAV